MAVQLFSPQIQKALPAGSHSDGGSFGQEVSLGSAGRQHGRDVGQCEMRKAGWKPAGLRTSSECARIHATCTCSGYKCFQSWCGLQHALLWCGTADGLQAGRNEAQQPAYALSARSRTDADDSACTTLQACSSAEHLHINSLMMAHYNITCYGTAYILGVSDADASAA
jgi:hypothetical protein